MPDFFADLVNFINLANSADFTNSTEPAFL